MKQALGGFTKNVAYAWGKEDIAGSIAPGRWADWVVLDGDVWADRGSARGLKEVKVKETWVGGERVFPKSDEGRSVVVVVNEGPANWLGRISRWMGEHSRRLKKE